MPAEPITATVHIEAPPERVFEYFTRPEALLRWMGEHAVVDPTPGGEFTVDIRGVPVRGRYLELEPPWRLLISWGEPVPAGCRPAPVSSKSACIPQMAARP